MIICRTCNTQNPDTAATCSLCGASLNQTVAGPMVASQVTGGLQAQPLSSAPAPSAPMSAPQQAIVGTGQANYLVPIVNGAPDTSLAFELPAGEFNFLLGRMDLTNGIVPNLDVAEKWPGDMIKHQTAGWLFSRKTAYLRRDGTTGQLFIRVDPDCGVTVLVCEPAGASYTKILPGDEVGLKVGSKLIFGYKNHGAKAEIR